MNWSESIGNGEAYMHLVAITGASGYIGRRLVAQLSQLDGIRIKVLRRRKNAFERVVEFGPRVEVISGDLHDPQSLERFVEPGCTVVHLAYLQGRGEDENLHATSALLEACMRSKIQRLIHCSTAAVVGRVPDDTVNETTPCRPVSEYGVTKLKIEKAVLRSLADGFDVVVLRPTSVFGPEGGSLKKLVADLMASKNIRNYFKSSLFGKRRMNLVHVDNVVAAIIFTIQQEKHFAGECYIVSEDDNAKNNFSDVEQFLIHQLEIPEYRLKPVILPLGVLSFLLRFLGRNNINPRCNYDPGKLLGIGFKRPVGFEQGLKHYSDWYSSINR